MFDILIIGGGPAGLTAGIYAARGGKKTAVLGKTSIGGQAVLSPEIENFPAIDKISGYELILNMQKQCKKFGVEFIEGEFDSLKNSGKTKTVKLKDGSVIKTKALIIATGAAPRKLGVENEDTYLGNGVSYCATCDGAFFKGKPVAVIGGGNTAVNDALYLKNFASEIYLIHRKDSLRATEAEQEKLFKSDVKIIWDSIVTKLSGTKKLTEIEVKNIKTDALSVINVNGVFVAVGQEPTSDDFDFIDKTDDGYIITDQNMKTSAEGIFAAGDVRLTPLRQVVTACSDGAIAANSALSFLED